MLVSSCERLVLSCCVSPFLGVLRHSARLFPHFSTAWLHPVGSGWAQPGSVSLVGGAVAAVVVANGCPSSWWVVPGSLVTIVVRDRDPASPLWTRTRARPGWSCSLRVARAGVSGWLFGDEARRLPICEMGHGWIIHTAGSIPEVGVGLVVDFSHHLLIAQVGNGGSSDFYSLSEIVCLNVFLIVGRSSLFS